MSSCNRIFSRRYHPFNEYGMAGAVTTILAIYILRWNLYFVNWYIQSKHVCVCVCVYITYVYIIPTWTNIVFKPKTILLTESVYIRLDNAVQPFILCVLFRLSSLINSDKLCFSWTFHKYILSSAYLYTRRLI